jgi:hypothetical protein
MFAISSMDLSFSLVPANIIHEDCFDVQRNQLSRIQILPHIIGSEEFASDIHCGLAGSDNDHSTKFLCWNIVLAMLLELENGLQLNFDCILKLKISFFLRYLLVARSWLCFFYSELNKLHRGSDPDNIGQERASVAAEPIDFGIVSEGEISETESDGFDPQVLCYSINCIHGTA